MKRRDILIILFLLISMSVFAQAGDNCATFDGTNDYISLGNHYKYTSGFTVEMWAYKTNWEVTGNEILISCTHQGGYNLSLINDDNGRDYLQFLYRNSTDSDYLSINYSTALSPGWHHFAISLDDTVARLYVDGIATSGAGSNISYDGDNHILLGAEAGSSGSSVGGDPFYFQGSIDEVRMWNTVLPAYQIRDWMHQNIELDKRPANYANLKGYFRFDSDLPNGQNDDYSNNVSDNPENDCNLINGVSTAENKMTPISALQVNYRNDARALWSAQTSNWSTTAEGLSLKVNSGSLGLEEFYALANDEGDNTTTDDCPTTITERTSRVWFIDNAGSSQSLDFDFETGAFAIEFFTPEVEPAKYKLLRRDSATGDFTVVASAISATDNGDGANIIFENYLPTDGYYTIGLEGLLVHFVNDDATGTNDGTSWTNAFTSLQSALDASEIDGYDIWVASGTYYPSSEFGGTGGRYNSFQMINNVAIYGGFSGSETDPSQRANYALGDANETILSGDVGVLDDNSDNVYHVIYNSDTFGDQLDVTAVIDGFTISHGNADGTTNDGRGGGMYNYKCSPTILNCSFINNHALMGGAITNYNMASPIVTNCIFSNNSGEWGGGYTDSTSSHSVITNCVISNNTASNRGGGYFGEQSSSARIKDSIISGNMTTGSGGGMCLSSCAPTMTNVRIMNNQATSSSGGVYCVFGTYTMINCLIENNTSTSARGGGFQNQSASTPPVLVNCTIVNNHAETDGGGITNVRTSPVLINTIIWGNTSGSGYDSVYNYTGTPASIPEYSYCDIEGSGGSDSWYAYLGTDNGNNIDANPEFAMSGLYPYTLFSNSPCADTGNDAAITELYDIRGIGFGRKLNVTDGTTGTVDMGAYEHKYGVDPINEAVPGEGDASGTPSNDSPLVVPVVPLDPFDYDGNGAVVVDPDVEVNPSEDNATISVTVIVTTGNETVVVPANAALTYEVTVIGTSAPVQLVLHFNGLPFDPTEIIWNDVVWSVISGVAWDYTARTATFTWTFDTPLRDGGEQFVMNKGGESTLPVQLSSFTAIQNSENLAELKWTTESESNLLGYNLFRSTQNNLNNSQLITSEVIVAQNSTTQQEYRFVDSEVEDNTTYYYWLQSIEIDGVITMFGSIEVNIEIVEDDEDIPETTLTTGIESIYPNPFNPNTTIKYSLKEDSEVSVAIYDIKGRKVASIEEGLVKAGTRTLNWNGKSFNNDSAPSGVYFIKLNAGSFTQTKKAILLK